MSRADKTGAAVSDLKPETATKVRLSEWLTAHGLSVAWEQKNEFGYNVFHVDDAPQKPDLLIQRPYGYTIAVETKRDDSKSSVYDALLQNNDYWIQYGTGQTEYTLNGETVDIDGFVVATGHSRFGRLFAGKFEQLIKKEDFGESRQAAVERGELPKSEFSMTEEYIRIQYRVAKKVSRDISAGVGALLSTVLDENIDNSKPAVLWWHENREEWVKL